MTPHDKLIAAMSIIQSEILARDSKLVADKMFPRRHFETEGLEMAERLLSEVLDVADALDVPEKVED
ncbi:hypothetical protein [Salipiger aestuarii]|uniref:hypothetical protein n=1 Tax=Salipiger aestuarii TaxID=568098 RepID=UPI0012398FF4|nr:hypothetical protein [Salipiger aestuarii]KAA8616257.1 hypothetical protein AL037_01505 [Salipiger aestuarii]